MPVFLTPALLPLAGRKVIRASNFKSDDSAALMSVNCQPSSSTVAIALVMRREVTA